jgi:pyridinium-3,5-bisthiocarboxylic acid mononucleotide nickel chelatase
MTLGALVDAGADLAAIQAGIDSLGLPSCRLVASEVKKRGFRALQIKVEHEPEHKHRHLHHITAMIDQSSLTPRAQELATSIFNELARAEAKVHGTAIEKVHFHEVGAVDSIADIVGSAIGFDLLGVERFECSPVPTGHGFIDIAHGRCSLPAPATAELLCGIPLAPLDVEGELTTPTGAAIVAALCQRFGQLPAMTVERIGYGAGSKDFPQANILRVLIGELGQDLRAAGERVPTEVITVLETNVDNVSAEVVAHAADRLWSAGALDVAMTPIQMKKGRPGVMISVQCLPSDAERIEAMLFAEVPTLGVRRTNLLRTALRRVAWDVATPWGTIAGKVAALPSGKERFTPEYEACAEIAAQHGLSLFEVMSVAHEAFRRKGDA